ncbi:hypothetical protein B0H16DRAFT_1304890 [Mycena metata]|uniref:Angiogenic factor with G patch and FHA domains 1 n=1 Tax=Mycena metata TaxID=1033252 RepID=A0AAD7NS27_9AGAR|nr:hypothetical protein B0H16DRAFT_1304890 [Mycena metata]
MEAGEIAESRSASPADYQGYDQGYEWPGEEPVKASDVGQSTGPLLRLLVLRTSVLPAKQTLAITDGYAELQFGRDIASSQDSPRVRLKEMEVSKFHATVYSDHDSWHIVDMGSKHGTFLQPQFSTTAVRLSSPRIASLPRCLNHLDTLTIGSTTFLVHIHPERAPCDDCCSTFENEIPLFASNKRKAAKVPEPDAGYLPATSGDPKKALTLLKQRLLTSSSPGPARSETSYTDRSARRRSLYPASRLDAPGIAPVFRPEPVASTSQSPPPSASWNPPIPVTVSQPPTPLPTTNIGHRLLLAQGWTPGSSLGTSEDSDEGRIRLTAPLEVASTSQRAGIGMGKATTPSDGWREDGRQRRWGELT